MNFMRLCKIPEGGKKGAGRPEMSFGERLFSRKGRLVHQGKSDDVQGDPAS